MDSKLAQQLNKLKKKLQDERLDKTLAIWDKLVWEPADKVTDPKRLEGLLEQFSDENIPKIVESEKDSAAVDDLVDDFSYDKHLLDFLKSTPFFSELSRWIRKREGDTLPNGTPLPTAAMCYNLETDDFELIYNKRWFTWLKYKFGQDGVKQIEGVTLHEFYHLIWKHVTTRRRDPMFAWNIATDAAINSIITENGGQMPKGGIIPGKKWEMPVGRNMTPEEKKMHEGLNDLIGSWPKMQASDWYFERLMQWSNDNSYDWGKNGIKMPGQPGEGGGDDGEGEGGPQLGGEFGPGNGTDKHDMWDGIPEEQRKLIEERLKNMVKRATRKADSTQSGWGNIPAEIRDEIRASVDDAIDWEAVLKNFIGMTYKGKRATSIKKINKRYAYIHPGVKRGYVARIAVMMDQSGSVSNMAVEQFFGVLRKLSKKVTFTLVPFDHTVDTDNIVEWRKGQTPTLKRTRAGGTSFDAPTDWINSPEQAGKYDGTIFLTDGECSAPGPCRVKRAWVICPNHKLMFTTPELVIQMEEAGKKAKIGGVVR